jgi:hypothetical protein
MPSLPAGQVNLPHSLAEGIIWVVLIGVIGGLWMLLARTRRRAEEARLARLRRDREMRARPEPEDPTFLP